MHACAFVCVHVCVCLCACVCMCASVCTCICVCMCVCVCVRILLAFFLWRTLTDTDSCSCVSSPPTSPCCLPSPWMITEHPQLILVPLSLTTYSWEFWVRLLCHQLASAVTRRVLATRARIPSFWVPPGRLPRAAGCEGCHPKRPAQASQAGTWLRQVW